MELRANVRDLTGDRRAGTLETLVDRRGRRRRAHKANNCARSVVGQEAGARSGAMTRAPARDTAHGLILSKLLSCAVLERSFAEESMQQTVEAPTPEALAALVARCAQINRYTTQLTAVEETRIAALSAGILTMRGVLDLPEIKSERLPARQRRIGHWALMGHHLSEVATPAIRHLHGTLAVDEHEQVKILSNRTWRGARRDITLWRDGVHGLSALDLM